MNIERNEYLKALNIARIAEINNIISLHILTIPPHVLGDMHNRVEWLEDNIVYLDGLKYEHEANLDNLTSTQEASYE